MGIYLLRNWFLNSSSHSLRNTRSLFNRMVIEPRDRDISISKQTQDEKVKTKRKKEKKNHCDTYCVESGDLVEGWARLSDAHLCI